MSNTSKGNTHTHAAHRYDIMSVSCNNYRKFGRLKRKPHKWRIRTHAHTCARTADEVHAHNESPTPWRAPKVCHRPDDMPAHSGYGFCHPPNADPRSLPMGVACPCNHCRHALRAKSRAHGAPASHNRLLVSSAPPPNDLQRRHCFWVARYIAHILIVVHDTWKLSGKPCGGATLPSPDHL